MWVSQSVSQGTYIDLTDVTLVSDDECDKADDKNHKDGEDDEDQDEDEDVKWKKLCGNKSWGCF